MFGLSRNEDNEPVAPTRGEYSVLEVDQDIINALSADGGNEAIRVRPFKNSRGIEDGKQFLKAIHDPLVDDAGRTLSPAHSFEMRFANDVVNFQFVPGEGASARSLSGQLQTSYPDSHFDHGSAELIDAHRGEYISGTTLVMRKPTLYPIEHIDLEGFDIDPFASILKEMVTDFSGDLSDVVIQTMFRAAPRGWTDGTDSCPSITEIARELTEPTLEKKRRIWSTYWEEIEPSAKDKAAAKMVRDLRGEHGWEMLIRVFAISNTPENARDRVHKVAQMFGNYYESSTEQTFVPQALGDSDLRAMLTNAGSRTFVDGGMVHSRAEAAGLVHVPNDEVNINEVDWMVRRSDSGVPPGFPTFEEHDTTGYSDLGYGRYPTSWEQYTDPDSPWPYAVTPLNPDSPENADKDVSTTVGGHEFSFEAQEGGTYAGVWPRTMVENAGKPGVDQPLFIGIDEANGKPVPVLYHELFRHLFGGGRTGEGKTTVAMNLVNQLEEAEDTAGACMFLAEEDLYEAAQMFDSLSPESTVILEPQNEYSEHETGFNFLDTLHAPGQPGFDAESEMLLGDLLPMLDAEEFVRIKGVVSNMFRVVITLHNDPDHDGKYTPLDVRFMLENPEEYVAFVQENGLKFLIPQARKIAELNEKDLEPLTRRLQDWTEAGDMRTLTSTRDSPISIPEIVASGTNLLVNISGLKDEAKQAVTTSVTRKIWSTVTSRPGEVERRRRERAGVTLPDVVRRGGDHDAETVNTAINDEGGTAQKLTRAAASGDDSFEGERNDGDENVDEAGEAGGRRAGEQFDAYVIVLDELHAILDEHSKIGQMLALARKKRLGIVLFTQQFGQLTKDQRKDVRGNCSTLLTGHPGYDPDEQRELSRSFRGLDRDDLQIDRFHAWTAITGPGGDLAEPFVTRLFPPHPPRRTMDEMLDAVGRIIEENGTPRKTDDERLSEVPERFRGILGEFNTTSDESGALSSNQYESLYKTIYDAQIRTSDDPLSPGPIDYDTLADALRRTLASIQGTDEETITDSQIESVRDHLKREHLHESSEYQYHVESSGLEFLKQDSPERADPRAGKKEHRRGVDHAYHWLTSYLDGCRVEIPNQGGETPDLRINDSFELTGSALAARKQRQAFEANHPIRATLTMGSDTAVEFEHTTKEKTKSLIGKVTRTYEADQACLFVTWSTEDAETVHRKLTTADAQREIPSGAHWHILVLPTNTGTDTDGCTNTPQLFVGPDADPTTLPIEDVSPQAVSEASTPDLFDF